MKEFVLTDEIIEKVKIETTEMVQAVMGKVLIKVVLYGPVRAGIIHRIQILI